jgi:hypothetical protein
VLSKSIPGKVVSKLKLRSSTSSKVLFIIVISVMLLYLKVRSKLGHIIEDQVIPQIENLEICIADVYTSLEIVVIDFQSLCPAIEILHMKSRKFVSAKSN